MVKATLIRALLLLLPFVGAGCQPFQPSEPTSNAAVVAPVVPQGSATVDPELKRNRQCAEIRRKIAEAKSDHDAAPLFASGPGFAAAFQLDANRKIAELESRYADLQCDVLRVVPGNPVIPPAAVGGNQSMSFDDCFKKCRELTSRSQEECFDACK